MAAIGSIQRNTEGAKPPDGGRLSPTCISGFPYFRFIRPDDSIIKIGDAPAGAAASSLGHGTFPANSPDSSAALLKIHRATPKNSLDINTRVNAKNYRDSLLIGYYLNHVTTELDGPEGPGVSKLLYIDSPAAFKRFKERYGVGAANSAGIDWDRVATEWGGVEMKGRYAKGWQPYEAVIWHQAALQGTKICPIKGKGANENAEPVFIIYSLAGCPYCKDVIASLDELEIPYTDYNVKEHEKAAIKEQHGKQTFPHVFLVGKDGQLYLIGGSEDFHTLLKEIAGASFRGPNAGPVTEDAPSDVILEENANEDDDEDNDDDSDE